MALRTSPSSSGLLGCGQPAQRLGCKCSTRFVSRAQHARYRREGITYPSIRDQPPRQGKQVHAALSHPSDRRCPGLGPLLGSERCRAEVIPWGLGWDKSVVDSPGVR